MLSKTCGECGNIFYKKIKCSLKDWKNKRKYCSQQCSWKNTLLDGSKQPNNNQRARGARNNMWKGGAIWQKCLICDNKINLRDYPFKDREQVKTCSRQCMTAFRQTEAYRKKMSDIARSKTSHISVETKALRNRLRRNSIYNLWRNKVLKKDNYTCKICGIRGGKLCVDHYPNPYIKIFIEEKIKTYKQAVDCKKLWLVSAGRTLCLKCHYKTDTFGSKVHNML